MKKLLSCILILSAFAISAQSAMAYDEYVYTSNGIIEPYSTTDYDVRLSSIASPGAIVHSDGDIFDTTITTYFQRLSEMYYACYGSSSCGDTLTVAAEPYVNFEGSEKQTIQKRVLNQINYINGIGGNMTGYTINSDKYDNYTLNISWDIDDVHHYAHFLYRRSYSVIGYYDLMYSDQSNSQYLIGDMNNKFSIAYEDQS